MAFDSCSISNYGSHANVKSLLETNKVFPKLKLNPLNIVSFSLGKPCEMSVIAYGDASHASLPSGASHGGVIVFLCG